MAQTLCPAQAPRDTEAQGCPHSEEASCHRELCLMRKLQAPGGAPSGPPAGARGSTNWVPATLSQGPEAGCLRAGGSRAQKGEPPPGRLLPALHSHRLRELPALAWNACILLAQPHLPPDLLPR